MKRTAFSLRFRIFAAVSLVAVAPLLALAWLDGVFARDVLLSVLRDHAEAELDMRVARLEAWRAGCPVSACPAEGAPSFLLHAHRHRCPGERFVVLDTRGVTLFSTHPADFPPGEPSPLPAPLRAGAREAFTRFAGPGGAPELGISLPVPGTGWIVATVIPESEALAPLRPLRDRAAVSAALALALILLAASWGAETLARPFRRLAEAARLVGSGRHDVRVGPLPGPEAAGLAEAFDRMLDEIESSHARLTRTATLAAVGELSSTVVHEMRNPLSSVKINLQALRRKVDGDELHRELAQIALEQVERLERMLTDLLHYGKPLDLRVAPTPFRELAARAIEACREAADVRRVSFSVADALGERPVMGDGELLLRALTNLVANAVAFSPEGGEVALSAAVEGGRIRLSVRDRGPGVSEADRARLFTPFFSSRSGGTGLGLANSRKIAERHGGTAEFENVPDGGARFSLLLPAGGPPRDPVERGASPA